MADTLYTSKEWVSVFYYLHSTIFITQNCSLLSSALLPKYLKTYLRKLKLPRLEFLSCTKFQPYKVIALSWSWYYGHPAGLWFLVLLVMVQSRVYWASRKLLAT